MKESYSFVFHCLCMVENVKYKIDGILNLANSKYSLPSYIRIGNFTEKLSAVNVVHTKTSEIKKVKITVFCIIGLVCTSRYVRWFWFSGLCLYAINVVKHTSAFLRLFFNNLLQSSVSE